MIVVNITLKKLRLARMFFFCLMISAMQLPIAGVAASKTLEKIQLEEAFQRIGQKYNVYFNYDRDVASDIMVEYEEGGYESLDVAVSVVLKNTNLSYQIFDQRFVVIFENNQEGMESLKEMIGHVQGFVEERENVRHDRSRVTPRLSSLATKEVYSKRIVFNVSGTVMDEAGEPLIGVNIQVKGTNKGTATDFDGNFILEGIDQNTVLVISYIGYQSQEVEVSGKNLLEIIMISDSQLLDEVVVIGYGTMKKSDLTGAVGSVGSDKLIERPSFNVNQAIAGRISGVNVQTNSGRPGGRTTVSIRGFSSINASNDPLYVLDGIIWTGDINDIDPNDIESIDILKDASSTAIYGTRGSNGVIMITTKKENYGSTINFSNSLSINWLPSDRKLKVLNSEQFMFIEDEQYKNAQKFDPIGFESGKYESPDDKRRKYLTDNNYGNKELFYLNGGEILPLYDMDWQDEVINTGISHRHNLSVNGGNESSKYGISLGLIDDQGIVTGSYAKRYNARFIVNHTISNWLDLGGSINYSKTSDSRVDEQVGANNALRLLVEMVPFIPYKYPDGSYGFRPDYAGLEEGDNPLFQLENLKTLYNRDNLNGNAFVNIKILPKINFNSTLGVSNLNNFNFDFKGSESMMSPKGMNEASINSLNSLFWQISNRLDYSNEGEFVSTNILLGSEFQKLRDLLWVSKTQNMPDDYYKWYNLSSGSNPQTPTSEANGYQMESYFTRLNFSLMKKYLITLTGRYDGSSRFGEDNKFAFFPSAAFAWRISEEEFMSNSGLSNLKLRTSFGSTGNSDIGSYRSQANLKSVSYPFNNSRVSGVSIDRLGFPKLQWEKSFQYNIGVDVGLLNNRIIIETDLYLKNTNNLLFDAPVPTSSGYSIVTRNIGGMRNKGFEINLNTVNVTKLDFEWRSTLNFSLNKNAITELGENNEDVIYGPRDLLLLRVGESVGTFYGYKRQGIWSTNEEELASSYGKLPGDLRIMDLNGDGVINSADRLILGKGIPDFFGSFINNFKYKDFSIALDIQFIYGNDIYMNSKSTGEARQGQANSFSTVLDAWTPTNQNAVLEQVRPPAAGYGYYVDDRRIENGSFIRGRNLLVDYKIPLDAFTDMNKIKLNVYLSIQNFFLITDYTGYDPEVSTYDEYPFAQGVTFYDYPKPRTFTIGLNVKF